MVAAPQYASITVTDPKGRITRTIDSYLSDVDAAVVRFDNGQGASSTSGEEFFAPLSGWITDFSIASGMTDTTKIQLLVNGRPTGDHLRYANHVNTLANRVPLRIPVISGQRVSAIQRA